MFYQTREIREKVLMLIAAVDARPFAVAVAAQIEGHRVLDRQTFVDQFADKSFPASPLIADTVDKNVGFLFGIAPLPIMQLQTVVDEILSSRFHFHELSFDSFPFFPFVLAGAG